MKAVIYESNAGSARRYAEMLASKLGVPAYSYKEAVKAIPRDEEAIFIGWIFANKIQGLPRAQKRWNLICAGAVGMNPPGGIYNKILHENNPTDNMQGRSYQLLPFSLKIQLCVEKIADMSLTIYLVCGKIKVYTVLAKSGSHNINKEKGDMNETERLRYNR